MSATIECSAMVQTTATGEVQCVDGTGSAVAWIVVPQFDIGDIDSISATSAFGAGFVLVGTAWAAGRGVKVLLDMLR